MDDLVENDVRIKSDFSAKGVNTVDFSKKLMGQIVFLYFLQKKGWFGVARDAKWGSGARHFLRKLLEGQHGKYQNFFNDILEPLFYEALRMDRSHDDDYYSRFNCKVPFLNGGLFDPIDPELLGKAYEKFNAIRPDNFEEYKTALKSGNKREEIEVL